MTGLHVQLDVEYANDPKMIDAGPMAELLYVRGLCFAKRTMKDGFIARTQLPAIAIGIHHPAKHAQRLVDVGAWLEESGGWRIAAWLKRNKSADRIHADNEAKRLKSLMGNHKQWHVDRERYDPTCELCNPYGESPPGSPRGSPDGSLGKEEPEEETQPETQEETEAQPNPPTQHGSLGAPTTNGQTIEIEAVLGRLSDGFKLPA